MELRQEKLPEPRAVFPVGDVDGVGDIEQDKLICQPCGEEEQADTPGALPFGLSTNAFGIPGSLC